MRKSYNVLAALAKNTPGEDPLSGQLFVFINRRRNQCKVLYFERYESTCSCQSTLGGRPYVPPLAGLGQIQYYTSDSIWEIREKPERLLVIGGGSIGCELTQAFTRLGVNVTQLDHGTRLLHRKDEEVSEQVMEQL